MKTEAVAYVLAYNKRHVWLKVPSWKSHRIFTLPRSWLKHGFAQYDALRIRYDPKSEKFDGFHFVADLEIIDGIEELESASGTT